MRTLIPALYALVLVTYGCQKPCTTTSQKVTPWGDTIFTTRTYTNCADTLSYAEKTFRADSSIISEGNMLNGQKNGTWTYYGPNRRETVYRNGFEVEMRMYREDGNLLSESILGADSLYAEKQFYPNGKVEAEEFTDLNGYLTGHGILYDSTGRKLAEGDNIAEDVLTDTVYMESPVPPHDMQPVVISESGGKHGPWVYYGFDGTIIDTVNFDKGKAIWGGSEIGKWKLEEVVNGNPADSTKEVLMNMPDLVGYEFTADGKLGAYNTQGQTTQWGTYSSSPGGADLYVFDSQKETHHIFLFHVEGESMRFAIGSRIYRLKREG
jgi:antitoxin component YwqK of YwqJK toxin-antitoxin module